MSAIWETQKAIYEKLTGDETLMEMIDEVYDHVPERAEFPYITIGNIRAEDSSKLGVVGHDLYASITAYSRNKGRKEALGIMERVKILMNQELLIDGYSIVQVKLTDQNSSPLRGGETYQANQEYRIMVFAS